MKRFQLYTLLIIAGIHLAACNDSGPGEPSIGSQIEITRVTADSQTTVSGGVVETAVRVRRGGSPLADARVQFSVLSGDGNLSDTVMVTGPQGDARTLWFLGTPAGEQRLSAKVEADSIVLTATATRPVPGQTYFGRKDYIEYQPGELPVIISAPHGGSLKPAELADRSYGVIGLDTNTQELTREVGDAFERITGKRPHLIINRLHRSKIDANREIVEAAQGDTLSERAWNEFQLWIETARDLAVESHGRGFYIDMHAHGHPIQRLELGYLLNAGILAVTDEFLDQQGYIDRSSIRTLATESDLSFPELIRGQNSFGEILVRKGYPTVPSASDPAPGDDPYFSGGYNTGRHASRGGGLVDGLQIEHNNQGVRNNAANRAAYAQALAETIIEYMDLHMGVRLDR